MRWASLRLRSPRSSLRETSTYYSLACYLLTSYVRLPLCRYEISFLKPPTEADGLFVCNRLVDIAFIIDMCAQFFIVLQVAEGTEGVRLISDQRVIAWKYITSWFPLDLFATGLSALDFISLHQAGSTGEAATDVSQLKVLRVVRVLRLVKLVRLTRASRLFERWETKVGINYALLSLARVTLMVLLYLHWSACAWGVQLAFQGGADGFDLGHTWLGHGRYCVLNGTGEDGWDYSFLPPTALSSQGTWVCRSPETTYVAALYTCASVSAIIASPGNTVEQVTSVLLMLAGGTVWAQVTGVFCGVLSTMNPHVTQFRVSMDQLNAFMSKMHFSPDLRWRLRQYFHRSRHMQVSHANNQLMHRMSPLLQGEVLWNVNRTWLGRVRFLRGCEPEFIAKVLLALRPQVFTPDEVIFGNELYILHHGIAIYGGRVLTSGGVWGEDMLITNDTLRSRYHAKALSAWAGATDVELVSILPTYQPTYLPTCMYLPTYLLTFRLCRCLLNRSIDAFGDCHCLPDLLHPSEEVRGHPRAAALCRLHCQGGT